MRAAQRSHSVMPCAPATAAQRHIILDITPPPLTLFPLSAGAFARHSNGKLLIFICPLDFCAGLHILEVGNAIRPISMGFHAKTKPPRSCRSEGVLVLVLTALAHQAVKPLAEIVCYYFRCNGDDRRQRRKQGGAVGAAACKMRVPPKARSRCREPQPVQDARRAAVPV